MTPKKTNPGLHVGRRLASARLMRGIAQAEIARRAEIAPAYLSRVETGKIQPTFRTVMHIASALGADLSEIAGPTPEGTHPKGPCPVTTKGKCLLDLIASERDGEHYSPREIRLIRRFAAWLKSSRSDRIRAMEVLLEDLGAAASRVE
jgi:transcriptional regulator with XRE-family HTH domain